MPDNIRYFYQRRQSIMRWELRAIEIKENTTNNLGQVIINTIYEIREVYFDSNNEIIGMSEHAAVLSADTHAELMDLAESAALALSRPILRGRDIKEISPDAPVLFTKS